MVTGFFLLSHFSVAEDFEFPKKYKSSSKCAIDSEIYLDPSLSFYFNRLQDVLPFKIAIWADCTALNSSCDKTSDLSQQVEIEFGL